MQKPYPPPIVRPFPRTSILRLSFYSLISKPLPKIATRCYCRTMWNNGTYNGVAASATLLRLLWIIKLEILQMYFSFFVVNLFLILALFVTFPHLMDTFYNKSKKQNGQDIDYFMVFGKADTWFLPRDLRNRVVNYQPSIVECGKHLVLCLEFCREIFIFVDHKVYVVGVANLAVVVFPVLVLWFGRSGCWYRKGPCLRLELSWRR